AVGAEERYLVEAVAVEVAGDRRHHRLVLGGEIDARKAGAPGARQSGVGGAWIGVKVRGLDLGAAGRHRHVRNDGELVAAVAVEISGERPDDWDPFVFGEVEDRLDLAVRDRPELAAQLAVRPEVAHPELVPRANCELVAAVTVEISSDAQL